MTLHMIYEEMISLYILERVKIKCITLNQFLCDKILHNKNGTEKWSRFSGSPINTPDTKNGDQAIKRIVSILKNNICSKVEKINVAI